MKKFILSLIITIFTVNLYAQSTGKNYVKETVYRTESLPGGGLQIYSPSNFENIIYYDRLGRPEQLIEKNASPVDQKNIVKHIEYTNNIGQTKDYLPFTVEGKETTAIPFPIGGGTAYQTTYNGNFVDNAGTATLGFYNTSEYENTQNPFSEIKTKGNLKKEVTEVASPGSDWAMANGHTVKLDTDTNTASEVKFFKAAATWSGGTKSYSNSLSDTGYFAANELKKQVVKNENWLSGKNNTTEIFKGVDGKVHLKRAYNNNQAHDTYYVYNQLGQLSFVLTPEALDTAITEEVLNELCFRYNYDANGMLVEKKVPGKKWEYIVYDKGGRIAFSGPNLNPFGDGTEGWMFVKYDYLNRPVYKGFYTGHLVDGYNRASLDTALKNQSVHNENRQTAATVIDGIQVNYTNQVLPVSSVVLLDVSYYDSYAFANVPATLPSVNGVTPNPNVKGLLTGAWTRNITTAADKNGDLTYLAYNNKYKPVSINTSTPQGGSIQINSTFNFFGNPTQVQTIHKKSSSASPVTTVENFTYNSREYLLKHTHTVNGQTEELLASYEYDELGKLKRKNVGNNVSQPLQKVDYKYNVRGWLTQINNPGNLDENSDNDLFGLKINYNTLIPIFTLPGAPDSRPVYYNGNVNSVEWKTRTDNIKREYQYVYDNLNRLTSASGLYTSEYTENVGYSKNGNITSMYRTGGNINGQGVTIDDAAYSYNYNKLTSVNDTTNHPEGINDFNKTGDDFTYDTFGNLIVDKNRKITNISYNHFNQPVTITFATGDNIAFAYDSYGSRIKKTVTQNGSTDVVEYINGYEYKNNQLKYIATSGGFIKFENNQYHYVYQYKDQVGNVRLTYQDINKNGFVENTEILNESNYYPFGLKHGHYNQLANNFSNSLLPNAGFNGQPSLVDLDANLSLMDFRLYDGALGRFAGIDMLADMFSDHSPYHFGYNNPISFMDPTGLHNDPARPIVTSGSWGELIEINEYDGWELVVNVNRKEDAPYTMRIFGTDPHQYGGGGGSDSGSLGGSGAGGGGGSGAGSGAGSGNNDPREASNGVLEGVQLGLDAIGLFDPTGIADGINAVIYAANGDYTNAALSAISILPLGDIVKAGKLGMKAADVASTAYKPISNTAKAVGEGIPNSVYNYMSKDGHVVSKYFYNDAGKVDFQIDFRDTNSIFGVHGHSMSTPGMLGSGHMNGHHVPFMLIPKKYW